MANLLEEKLREAACVGDLEAAAALLSQNIDVNSQNPINGWTALHWACKRGNENIVRLLLNYGADKLLKNFKEETPSDICHFSNINELLGTSTSNSNRSTNHPYDNCLKFVPNYIKNAPINARVFNDVPIIQSAPQDDELILKIRLHGSSDPDFIEIEISKQHLTYANLLKICCQELDIVETQVERIRKLPNTRLRNDNDIKRLTNFQALEILLKNNSTDFTTNNCYQSISSCKDQQILY